MSPESPESPAEREEMLRRAAEDLAEGIEEALGPWVVASVERIMVAYSGRADAETLERAGQVGGEAAERIGAAVRELLDQDVDDQPTNPLAILRQAVTYPTRVLRDAGVPPVVRDEVAERQFPDDDYDLTPASFADISPDLHEPGIRWGAAKAHVILQRRRQEGRR